ncbi:hypothetical protein DM860_013223 [Cuscuta australis]|uniref:Homeobox domain-containing protein n=1 Tax=Cuscuta australis TaxID=267555 RepID=A0A328DRH2_9ASTE|nr:hypothetical protein DM860_013223 [Cuscuta australis]
MKAISHFECARLRPPRADVRETSAAALDLKSFARGSDGSAGGGTRWNPTEEQIGVLEMMYRGGMRAPNARQIEHITAQLEKYGRIEGKNVFYWFQNHKARERQRHKRNAAAYSSASPSSSSSSFNHHHHHHRGRRQHIHSPPALLTLDPLLMAVGETSSRREGEEMVASPIKKKWNSFEEMKLEEEEDDKTLQLFPLHPEFNWKIP